MAKPMDVRNAAPEEHGLDRREDDEQVERDRQVLDVEEVVLQLLHRVFDARAVGVAHLRPSGQAGPDDVALAVERNLLGQLLDELRPLGPRADEAHVADQHVPQLRQLVEPRAAQEAADRRDAVVVLPRPHRAGCRLGVLPHRTELVDREDAAVLADALLVIEGRTGARSA